MATNFFDMDEFVRQVITSNDPNADFKFVERRQKLFFQDGGAGEMEQFPLSTMAMGAKLPGARNTKVRWGGVAYDARNFEVAGIYSDTALQNLIAAGADNTSTGVGGVKAGATVYFKAVATTGESGGTGITNLKRLRQNMQLDITDRATNYSVKLHVYSITFTGGAPYATCILKTTDPKPDGVAVLSSEGSQNLWCSLGATSQVEGDVTHDGAYQGPQEWYNYTEILSEPVEMTGSEATDDSVFDKTVLDLRRMQAKWEFKNQWEHAIRYGVRMGKDDDQSTGLGLRALPYQRDGALVNGKSHTMGGIEWFLNNYELYDSGATKNILRVNRTTTFNGVTYTNKPWDYAGKPYLMNVLSYAGKTGPTTRLGLCGNKALYAIEDACQYHGQLQLGPWTDSPIGFRTRELRGGKITLQLKEDEQFSNDPAHERDLWIVPQGLLKFQAKQRRDLTYIPSTQMKKKGGFPDEVQDAYYWRDAGEELWIGEGTIIMDNLPAFMIIKGVGLDFETG